MKEWRKMCEAEAKERRAEREAAAEERRLPAKREAVAEERRLQAEREAEEKRAERKAEEKRAKREAKEKRVERDAGERKAAMEFEWLKLELEAKRLETAARLAGIAEEVVRRSARIARSPELPVFVDGRDDLGNDFLRFERYATVAGWEKGGVGYPVEPVVFGPGVGSLFEVVTRRSDGLWTSKTGVVEEVRLYGVRIP